MRRSRKIREKDRQRIEMTGGSNRTDLCNRIMPGSGDQEPPEIVDCWPTGQVERAPAESTVNSFLNSGELPDLQ